MASSNSVSSLPPSPLSKQRSQLLDVWQRFTRNRIAVAGLIIVLLLVLMALLAPVLAPQD
ncbi:MAG: hypothetical protein KDE53_17975, partial [Caldilineaceae bacterium]|nr:hypothetical protein [Caldilineaceae bacterium]